MAEPFYEECRHCKDVKLAYEALKKKMEYHGWNQKNLPDEPRCTECNAGLKLTAEGMRVACLFADYVRDMIAAHEKREGGKTS